ncbi:Calcineurin-like phosphoesterase family protein [Theileria parva strain Muguga]|uniref:Serine/threonine-protein phosphatase n=1 Tax=Theileria parva TaxID=5875 RepID=Q4N2C8_THEPA|nr:Calcineurin-like phosphoesterase family protein [Theileria parva strain Muguga]EAN31775.1 Calcineurin-like phosphoesterase family protein [Theileria parva strain Muguga]|eukprot:XP_764058.1 serine/threonine protein phosphatase [Theileria parva strain Muguga]
MANQLMAYQKVVPQQGDVPPPRFGHTSTSVGSGKVVLFGGAVGDVGRYTITSDSFLYDVTTNYWTKLQTENPPSPRAAHAAACVETMQVVVFGGATGGGALSSDDLFLLDLRREKQLSWIIVPTTGRSPGRRYGHTMVFSKPNLILIGGNDGQQPSNDVWVLNVEQSPFTWNEVTFSPTIQLPPTRVYHSADLCCEGPANGMIVIFGGRGTESRSLNDVWGLRQHRDGTWDWIEAPVNSGTKPDPRYQHSCAFVGSKFVVLGGRSDSDLNKSLSISVYDTETLEWFNISTIQRFRHSSWRFGPNLYIFGGFANQTQKHPTCELKLLDCQSAFGEQLKSVSVVKPWFSDEGVDTFGSAGVLFQSSPKARDDMFRKPQDREIRLSAHAHAVRESVSDFSYLVRKISIDRLEDEGRKINKPEARSTLHWQNENSDTVYDRIIMRLLSPNELKFQKDASFPISYKDINTLLNTVYHIVKEEDTVLNLRAPIKIYGDIHGQYHDLMRLFKLYKSPLDEYLAEALCLEGDIESNDYLFLGDYVDRGFNSLEVICLLFALKCKYPAQIHLIRGNHEDPAINAVYGFQNECARRLNEDVENPFSCWNAFNKIFEMLPLGALIEGRILCVHGGIGKSVERVDDIRSLKRPISVIPIPECPEDQLLLDLLWSDPTDNDSMLGTVPNEIRDPDRAGFIVKFGPDRVLKFLTNNDLQLIIRAHECVMDGFERFAGGRLITLFSATNYCNHHKNAGALLFIRRDLTIVPKLIYPCQDETSYDSWDMRMSDTRPPTPPRSTPMARDMVIEQS